MAEEEKEQKKEGISLDWLVGGVLSKFGETVDRVTGRGWNPSSSLATSKLIEKLKFLMDEEVKDLGSHRKFAPHKITLKMQWNKFAADIDEDIEALTTELHAAAIDHINDRLYHTYAPIEIEIKTDYFTEGVRLIGSFGEFGEDEEEAAVNVTLPGIRIEETMDGKRASIDLVETPVVKIGPGFAAAFTVAGIEKIQELDFSSTKRYSVGREKSNGLAIQDQSVSQVHASIVIGSEGKLMVADTGSTNGTYIGGERIAYGKAFEIEDGSVVRFGTVEVKFKKIGNEVEEPSESGAVQHETEPFVPAVGVEENQIAKPTVAFSDENPAPEPVTAKSDEWSEFSANETNDEVSHPSVSKSREDWEV